MKAELNFHKCIKKFHNDRDLNGDGKYDWKDDIQWLILRGFYNLNPEVPPFTPTPPGYGTEGPGSNDNPPFILPDDTI